MDICRNIKKLILEYFKGYLAFKPNKSCLTFKMRSDNLVWFLRYQEAKSSDLEAKQLTWETWRLSKHFGNCQETSLNQFWKLSFEPFKGSLVKLQGT